MLRRTMFFVGISALLFACEPIDVPSPVPSATVAPTESRVEQPDPGVQVWSLGGNGWALRVGERMLVFDYVEKGNLGPPTSGGARNLLSGYIDPSELRPFKVYVFVTHSHQDHFDPVILEWQDHIDQIVYFFGWQAGNNPEHHYMSSARAQALSDGVEVFTINSHSDVPEVAYVVKVDGITIYHNGDYRGSYLEDFEYLQTITDHVDVAFVIGWPYVDHQHFQQAMLLAEMFDPTYMFANCREGDEDTCRQFSELLAEHGVEIPVLYAEHRGADFVLSGMEVD